MNFWQKKYLADRGKTNVNDLSVFERLEWANLSTKPDPDDDGDDTPPMTPAAAEWLGGRDLDSLSPASRKEFDILNSDLFRAATPEPKATPRTIDTAKLVALPPEQRLSVVRASETLAEARRERASGGDPRTFRFSDAQVAAAELLTRPHWSDEC